MVSSKTRRNSGWRGHSKAQESQVSWLEVEIVAYPEFCYDIFSQRSWSDTIQVRMNMNEGWVWFFKSQGHKTWRSWVLKSYIKENMTWSKRTGCRSWAVFLRHYVWSSMRPMRYLYSMCGRYVTNVVVTLRPLRTKQLHVSYIYTFVQLGSFDYVLRVSVNISEEMTQCSRIWHILAPP